jgi:flagellar biogenesis protein FliO
MTPGGSNDSSSEAGVVQILILILVVLAIIALTIWIVQQLT